MLCVTDISKATDVEEIRITVENKFDANATSTSSIILTMKDLIAEDWKNVPILGVFRNQDKSVKFLRPINKSNSVMELYPIINKIITPELKHFALLVAQILPEYFYHVPASSTGKYHPVGDLGEGGLVRHTESVCNMLLDLTKPESIRNMLVQGSKPITYIIDCMYVACVFHDSLKSGWQHDYEENPHTRHEHPYYAADMILGMENFLPTDTLVFIAGCIVSHMGEWNTNKFSSVVLPKPSNIYQIIVHLADYLASRENIVMEHNVKGVMTYFVPDDRQIEPTNRFGENKDNLTI